MSIIKYLITILLATFFITQKVFSEEDRLEDERIKAAEAEESGVDVSEETVDTENKAAESDVEKE